MMGKNVMHTRPAHADEQAVLFEIHRSVFHAHIDKLWGWDEAWQLRNFAAECGLASTCVIEVDGCVAGYLQILEQPHRIYVQNIALLEAFQGRGVGGALLKRLQAQAVLKKLPLQLGVFRTNAPAQRLYVRLGFVPLDETATHLEMQWIDPQVVHAAAAPTV